MPAPRYDCPPTATPPGGTAAPAVPLASPGTTASAGRAGIWGAWPPAPVYRQCRVGPDPRERRAHAGRIRGSGADPGRDGTVRRLARRGPGLARPDSAA